MWTVHICPGWKFRDRAVDTHGRDAGDDHDDSDDRARAVFARRVII